MNRHNSIEVIDTEGWRKVFPIEKHIIHIGSGGGNDIALFPKAGGSGVSWRLQLIALPTRPPSYRLVNLGSINIFLESLGEQALEPRSVVDIGDNEHIQVEQFRLVLHCTEAAESLAGVTQQSTNIGLELYLPETQLNPGREVVGYITVNNLGNNEQGAQFKLELEGLEPDCYELGAGPLLFPGAKREVMLRIFHPQRPNPQAGARNFYVYATAPEAYPGERAAVGGNIYILPFFKHELRVVDKEDS